MKLVLCTLAALSLLMAAGAKVQAQGYCGSDCCPTSCNYETREIITYRNVCETKWKEVKVTRYRPQTYTVLVEEKCTVAKPVMSTETRDVTQTYLRKVVDKVKRDHNYVTYEPVTVMKTIQVDQGHFVAPACQASCDDCCYTCCASPIWVPKMVSKQIACTNMVCKPHHETIEVPVCRLVPETVTKKISVPVCHMTYQEVSHKVPVTRCKMVAYEATEHVPYTVTKKIACHQTICVPVGCTSCDN